MSLVSSKDKMKQRMYWMDGLRGVAILLVLFWHAPAIPSLFGFQLPETLAWANNFLSPYRMPILLVLSGILLPSSVVKPLGQYYAGKARHVLWPWGLWTVVITALLPPPDVTSPWYWLNGTYLWFLMVLCACYLVGPLTRKIPSWTFPIAMIGLLIVQDISTNAVINVLWFGAYFFFGAWISKHLAWWQSQPWWAAIGLGAVAVGWGWWTAANGHVPTGRFEYAVLSIAGVLALLWAAPRLPRVRVLEWVGRRSIVFYASHFPVMLMTWYVLEWIGATGVWLMVPVQLGVAGLVGWLLSRTRSAQWLFSFPVLLRRTVDASH